MIPVKGTHHRAAAAAIWPALATVADAPHWQTVIGILPAVAFSAGVTSPDWDQLPTRRFITRWVPGKWDDRLFAHRETTHWFGWPALLALLTWQLPLGPIEFLLWAAIVGWSSHIVTDAIWGRGGHSIREGVPLLVCGNPRIAVGFKSDGIASAICIGPLCASLWWWTLGHPGAGKAAEWAAGLVP